jgi:hypothetical protein
MPDSVLELFREEPWLSARETAERTGLTLDEVRGQYASIRGDSSLQSALDSLDGPQRFFLAVLRDALLRDSLLASVLDGAPPSPWMLELHTGPACPCRCVFCYSMGAGLAVDERGYQYTDQAGMLDKDGFIRIINAFADAGGQRLVFSGGLEPLTCGFLPELLREGVALELDTWLYTNGLPKTLDPRGWRWVVDNLASIRFSVHGATADAYHATQVPHVSARAASALFERATRRVASTVGRRDDRERRGAPAAKIGVALVAVPQNWVQVPLAARMWGQMGVDFFDIRMDALTVEPRAPRLTSEQMARLKDELIREALIEVRGTRTRVSAGRRPLSEEPGYRMASRCYAPLAKVAVDPWGNLFTCCMRAHPTLSHPSFRIGKLTAARPGLGPHLRRASLPLGWHCNQCPDWEVALNKACSKIEDDFHHGIAPDQQPVTPRSFNP